MNTLEIIKQKASFLNNLSNNEDALFEYINNNHENLDEVIHQYKPERGFKPVNTLRFLIASELKKGNRVTVEIVNSLKQAIENRDVSSYYSLNDAVQQSLANYKDSKKGMFPNWRDAFKVLFPFIHSISDNKEVKTLLDQLVNQIVETNNLQNIKKHPISFQGSQNYGSDHIWVAIYPKASPNVQSAYQIFFSIDHNGIKGGIHKGHKLEKGIYSYDDEVFNRWEAFLENTKSWVDEWQLLNSRLDFSSLKQSKYYLVGAYWKDTSPKDQTDRFVREGVWVNGYEEDKSLSVVNKVNIGDHIAIRSVDKRGNNMYIKARGIVTSNLRDGRHLEVEWEKEFEVFKLNFSGGYWDTIRKLIKESHINAVWSNNKNMENVKQEFIDWYIANPRSSYFNNQPEKIDDYLTKSLEFFSKDIFLVSRATYKEMVEFIEDTINNNKAKFLKNHGAPDSGKLAAIVGKRNYQKFLLGYFEKKEENASKKEVGMEYKRAINQIFYGPPGTGKTYSTILEAAKIIEQEEVIYYDESQKIFNEHLGGRIEFITFHQNYSYEDFIQGLRPDIEQKELSFNRADGVFTKMVTNALFEYYKVYQQNQKETLDDTEVKIDLNDAYIEFLGSLKEGQEFETKTGSKIKVDNFTDRQNIEFKPLNGVKSYLVSGNRLLKLYDVFKDIDEIKLVHEDIRGAIGGCNSTIYYVALREFISFLKVYEDTLNEFVDIEEDYDDDNITYRRKKELLSNISLDELRTVSENDVPKYVIIIDEINRANISRVFGELITLIEKDKRSGGDIPLSATLPSGEKFIVPSNLYIIGTMNTADKSIALLDIALRRRFEFVPMYPKVEIIIDGNNIVNDAEILQKLNNEIVSKKGHDFTIGHSYFMGKEYVLKNTVDNKVIPLLLEYFMNDFGEVEKILKKAGLTVEGWPMKLVRND
ncbi:dynein-related subfamily AAA family protein [Aquimarina sp. MAR_2010_214]|uniref:McrB family protein n=1 Tax=Aquimarina sp. MAR_2010_214 TaxID=1250026 RepID=UPI000C70911F|nr:AAA family ATPase [Aquimarina sp. MAR_2010_214]PKV51896.1 dynein-related subfamily AAA family protein [Aquimarina sp. MAR_2010_214]